MFESKSDIKALLKQTSKELLECKTIMHDIVTKNVRGVLIIDENGTVCLANPAAEVIFGCTSKELMGRNFDLPLTPGETKELKMLTKAEKPITVEIWSIKSEWKGNPAFYVSILDITKRKEQENELRKMYRAIMHSPSSVIITDNQARIEYVNPKFTEVTGYTFAEVVGKTPSILNSGKVPPEVFERMWETISSGEEWRGEFVNRKKSGELYYESASISPVRDFDGKITNYIAVKEDITEHKLLEAEIERLSFPQVNPSPVLELDAIGMLTFANKAAEEILEATPDGNSNPFLPTDLPEILHALQNHEDPSYIREIEINGLIYEEHIYLVPRINAIRIYAKDITALRRAEEQLEQMAARLRACEQAHI